MQFNPLLGMDTVAKGISLKVNVIAQLEQQIT